MADKPAKWTQMLLFDFPPAFLKRVRAWRKERGGGAGVVPWHVGAEHSGTASLQADHLTLSESLVPLSNKRRESLAHSPTYSHCPKTKHWKHLLMETITHDPNEGTWEVTGCPLDSHSNTTWGKHCGYCRSSLQQGDGHTSSTLSLVAHALEPFA